MDITVVEGTASLDYERAHALLRDTYWAKDRTMQEFKTACEHSLCYGLCHGGVLVGFARVVTDFATMFYIGDVVVDPQYRGQGFGVRLLGHIMKDARFNFALGMLLTSDAHGLYEKFGFVREGSQFMSCNKL